jgi:hypothetical protein
MGRRLRVTGGPLIESKRLQITSLPSSNKPDVGVELVIGPCERPFSESMWSLLPQLQTDATVVSSRAVSSYPSSAGGSPFK